MTLAEDIVAYLADLACTNQLSQYRYVTKMECIMALSNAERQKQFRDRAEAGQLQATADGLKAKALVMLLQASYCEGAFKIVRELERRAIKKAKNRSDRDPGGLHRGTHRPAPRLRGGDDQGHGRGRRARVPRNA